MQHYIRQLIENLDKVAKTPPPTPFIEPPPHLANDPVVAELALSPFKTIEELTGIKQEVFPEVIQLNANLCSQINEAIFRIFESLNIELVDAPPDIPPEWLYEVLSANWQHEVQYLPSSGMDLELCTGNPMTCPYGDYCDCSKEFDEYELPEKFAACINPIAQSIDAGFVCYLNPETLEMEDVPKSLTDELGEFNMKTVLGPKYEELEHEKWDKCYVFKPPDAHESFKFMEVFAENVEDEILHEELIYVLNHKQPFANFKAVIHNSGQSDNWFFFKMNCLEDRVKQIIYAEIHKEQENLNDHDLPF